MLSSVRCEIALFSLISDAFRASGVCWEHDQRMPPHFIFSSRKSHIHAGTAPNCTFSVALKQLVLEEMFSTVVLKSEIFLWRSRCLQCKSNVAFLFSILLLFLPTYKMSPYWKNGNTTVEWWWKQVACSSGCGAVCCSPCMYMTFSATGNEIKKQSLLSREKILFLGVVRMPRDNFHLGVG